MHSNNVYYNPFPSTNCLQSPALSFTLFPSSILYFSKLKPTSLQAKIIDILVVLEAVISVQILCEYFYIWFSYPIFEKNYSIMFY